MRQKTIMLISVIILITGCALPPTSTFYQKTGSNLNSYKYVTVSPLTYDNDVEDKFGIRNLTILYLNQMGFTVLSETETKQLDKDDYNKYLFCSVSHIAIFSKRTVTVTIEFFDIFNEKVFSATAEHDFQYTDGELSLLKATELAISKIKTNYTGFNSTFELDISEKLEQARRKAVEEFKDWETVNEDRASLRRYYDLNINNLDPLEGIWTSVEENRYRIGIIKDTLNLYRDFVAIIVETENQLWQPKQVKIEFEKTAYPRFYTTTYYMSDHSKQGITSFINDIGILQIELKNPDGSPLESNFIKNYPAKIEADFSGEFTGTSPVHTVVLGSGFVISQTGLTVTNYHVIQGKSEIEIYFPSIDFTTKAKISLKDKNNDIALLSLEDFVFSDNFIERIPFVLSNSDDLKLGQDVFTLGYPLGKVLGKSAKLSTGTISSIYGIQDDPRLIQISNPIQPGNSGGPLFNNNGDIIGIVVASLNAKYFYENESIIPQNVNFAIKSNYLLNIVSMLPEDEELSKRQKMLTGKSLEEQIELITPFVVTIKAK